MENINYCRRLCPICNSNNYKVIEKHNYNKFIYGRCLTCSNVYQITNYGDKFYAEHEYRTQVNYRAHSIRRTKYIVDFIGLEKFNKDTKLLDIGCGQGGVLYYLDDLYGVKGDGINPYPEKEYISNDIKIVGKFVTDLKGKNKYDIIIMSHVLEHMPNPKEALSKIYSLLKTNGVLYIEVPSYFLTKQKLNYVFVPEHISYFHRNTILNLLHDTNFGISKYKESIKWTNIKLLAEKYYLEYPIKYKNSIFSNYYLLYIINFFRFYVGGLFNKYRGSND